MSEFGPDATRADKIDVERGRGLTVVFGDGHECFFSNEELRLLEAEKTNAVDITEFVPASTVDFLQIEKTSYLGPDKGGHKAYALLGQVAENTVANIVDPAYTVVAKIRKRYLPR